MGYYIEVPDIRGKAHQLVAIYKGEIIPPPASFSEIPDDKALICVVENLAFEAAAYCYSEAEFVEFTNPLDPRNRDWVLLDKTLAKTLSDFNH